MGSKAASGFQVKKRQQPGQKPQALAAATAAAAAAAAAQRSPDCQRLSVRRCLGLPVLLLCRACRALLCRLRVLLVRHRCRRRDRGLSSCWTGMGDSGN